MEFDRSAWWWRKGSLFGLVALVLVATGVVAAPLQKHPWEEMRARQPALNLSGASENIGQGAILGLLGGFRAIIADFVWLRAYAAWEHRDRPNTETLTNLATTLNPSSVFFWSDAANKIGLDMASWVVRDLPPGTEPGHRDNPAATNRIYNEYAKRGIDILDRGLKFHPGSYRLLLDKAYLYRYRMHPPELMKAAESYLAAAEDPSCPVYAERIYALTLQEMNKNREAYNYLRKLYPTLPEGDLGARKEDVWDMLMDLENKLNLPENERLPLSAAPLGWSPGLKPQAPAPSQ